MIYQDSYSIMTLDLQNPYIFCHLYNPPVQPHLASINVSVGYPNFRQYQIWPNVTLRETRYSFFTYDCKKIGQFYEILLKQADLYTN